ncbi:Cation calcium exchanger [Quillaja saponaria]|uniref:Cation calcium exchanger n=1 Tax=Quillaja saponaria TaxID=32244 RepID=A0AAD7Q7S1_QUISA|nr:Cation calcium exchanger [Quillaja saponaria]
MSYILFLNISILLLACVFLIINFHPSESHIRSNHLIFGGGSHGGCKGLHSLDDYKDKCLYVKSNDPCVSQGYIDYLYLFYCKFGKFPFLGHSLLFLWLLVLFYLLANTASEYFCPSLENLSKLLKLSPTIAGVTLLSLGNGANDVFASIVSFTGTGTREIGFYTVVGGASFVSCVVVGIISTSVRHRRTQISKAALIRDVSFYLLVLLCLIVILVIGKINVLGAIGFTLIYVVYVIIVYASSKCSKGICGESEINGNSSYGSDLGIPILNGMEKGLVHCVDEGAQEYDTGVEVKKRCFCIRSTACEICLRILEMPLYLPRRLTIPVVCEERWSKPYAISSVTLAPLLLLALWIPYKGDGIFNTSQIIWGVGLLIGLVLGVLAFLKTEKSCPPKKCLFPWLAGGFLMSVTWSYISAQELVGLLVSLGYICGVSPSILGLTVLAWGNSLADLITNLTMALHDGSEGTQVAITGCYAGPIFNILVGLGLSLVSTSWSEYPSSIQIPRDPYLLETLSFLVGGLLWALFVLTRRDMRLDGVLGGGLLVIYFISLFVRLIQTLGSVQFRGM